MNDELTQKALEQSLELNKIQAGLLNEREKSNRIPWIALFVTMGFWFATICAGIWLWNQYDTVSSYEANGIYALIDSSGNIIAQDVDEDTWKAFTEWWEINGNSQSNKNTN